MRLKKNGNRTSNNSRAFRNTQFEKTFAAVRQRFFECGFSDTKMWDRRLLSAHHALKIR